MLLVTVLTTVCAGRLTRTVSHVQDEFKAMTEMLNASGAMFPGNFSSALESFDKCVD